MKPRTIHLGVGLLILIGASFLIGKVDLLTADPALRELVLVQLRLPRVLLALAVGGGLGLSGAALQGYTRNALADPGVLGVSAWGALGAVAPVAFGITTAWTTPAFGLMGAGLGVLGLTLAATRADSVGFLLIGVVLNVLASAGVALVLTLSPDPWAASEITHWLMGSLADRSLDDLATAAPLIGLGALILVMLGWRLDALTLGELGARSLGVSLRTIQVGLAVGVGLVCGGSVAVTGVIGFVGLMAPNMARLLAGPTPSRLLIPSSLLGAGFLLAADDVVRLIPAANEAPVGVATAVLGAPAFLWLLSQRRAA